MEREMAGLACCSGLASLLSPASPEGVEVGVIHGLGAPPFFGSSSPCRHAIADGEGMRGASEDARRLRRLASNRESARRSRARRRRQLDELSARVAELRAANQRLVVELNRAESRCAQMARENARLREEARRLQGRLVGDDEEADKLLAEGGSGGAP